MFRSLGEANRQTVFEVAELSCPTAVCAIVTFQSAGNHHLSSAVGRIAFS
jgi:hypothetical protein